VPLPVGNKKLRRLSWTGQTTEEARQLPVPTPSQLPDTLVKKSQSPSQVYFKSPLQKQTQHSLAGRHNTKQRVTGHSHCTVQAISLLLPAHFDIFDSSCISQG